VPMRFGQQMTASRLGCLIRFRFRYVLHPFAAKYSHWMSEGAPRTVAGRQHTLVGLWVCLAMSRGPPTAE
jgi:hypothetical protein